jgi:FOG: WD40 repeat
MNQNTVTENVCVVTTRGIPSTVGSSHTNDVAQIIDPQTGSNLSVSGGGGMLKVGSGVGVYSISRIPLTRNQNGEELYMATCGKSKDDMSVHLIVQGCTSSPRWKCRLPEQMDGGLTVSPCGNYVVGAAKSGNCYCWSTFQEGELLKVWVAHYRPVQSIVFSDCGSFVITGGADGITNVWSLMDIVSMRQSTSSVHRQLQGKRSETLSPVKTWSEHQLPITDFHALPASRLVSTSFDRNVVIMELFSGRTLAKITMPTAINVVTADSRGCRLYLGSVDGTIYCVDIDAYAIAMTAEGAKVIHNAHNHNSFDDRGPSYSGTLLEETILGMDVPSSNTGSYISELRGHEGEVTCLAVLEENGKDMLASGGMDGSIRFWDLRSRCCMKTVFPWSSTSTMGIDVAQKSESQCPCSSITVIPRSSIESKSGGINVFTRDGNTSDKVQGNLIQNLKPLQRFPKEEKIEIESSISNNQNGCITNIIPPGGFGVSRAEDKSLSLPPFAKRMKTSKSNTNAKANESMVGIQSIRTDASILAENDKLKKDLANAKEMMERWQKVAMKLKKKTATN